MDCVKILCKHFGFEVVRRRGSHIILCRQTPSGKKGTVVPNHRELKVGTLKGLLELGGVDEEALSKCQ
ncbi:MAG: type II toxin-antitoxin system HicA family toxin [Candidatus Micrarchaeota archaeon]